MNILNREEATQQARRNYVEEETRKANKQKGKKEISRDDEVAAKTFGFSDSKNKRVSSRR